MSYKNIELSQEKIDSLERYRKSFGNEWVEEALDSAKANIYREIHLEKIKDKSYSRSPYNCYSEGVTVYRRKDGNLITQNDIDAVKANRIGQGHSVTASSEEIVHKWAVDSSG